MAQIATIRLQAAGITPTGTYTFAAARASGERFSRRYEAAAIPTIRYENQGDVVPHLPPSKAELQAFRQTSDPFLVAIERRMDYQSVVMLRYIRENLAVITPHTTEGAELEQMRLHAFEAEVRDRPHTQVLEGLAASHSIGTPTVSGPGNDHRYFRAVCGERR